MSGHPLEKELEEEEIKSVVDALEILDIKEVQCPYPPKDGTLECAAEAKDFLGLNSMTPQERFRFRSTLSHTHYSQKIDELRRNSISTMLTFYPFSLSFHATPPSMVLFNVKRQKPVRTAISTLHISWELLNFLFDIRSRLLDEVIIKETEEYFELFKDSEEDLAKFNFYKFQEDPKIVEAFNDFTKRILDKIESFYSLFTPLMNKVEFRGHCIESTVFFINRCEELGFFLLKEKLESSEDPAIKGMMFGMFENEATKYPLSAHEVFTMNARQAEANAQKENQSFGTEGDYVELMKSLNSESKNVTIIFIRIRARGEDKVINEDIDFDLTKNEFIGNDRVHKEWEEYTLYQCTICHAKRLAEKEHSKNMEIAKKRKEKLANRKLKRIN
jgi:hypothetical protein